MKPHKPIKRKVFKKECESCQLKDSDFVEDAEDKDIVRVYCKARYAWVNVELMSGHCDFYNRDTKNHPLKG